MAGIISKFTSKSFKGRTVFSLSSLCRIDQIIGLESNKAARPGDKLKREQNKPQKKPQKRQFDFLMNV